MSDEILLARLADLPELGARSFNVPDPGGYQLVLLVRRGDELFAYENFCPHAGYPLQRPDGSILIQERRYLVCAAHGASFVLDTGACAGGPCSGERLTPLAIEVRDGAVFMPLPPRPPGRHPAQSSDRGGGA